MSFLRARLMVVIVLLVGLAVLVGLACGGGEKYPTSVPLTSTPTSVALGDTVQIELKELNRSGQTGTAVLTEVGNQTRVEIEATPGIAKLDHIHTGPCNNLGGVVYPLTDIDALGKSTTLVDASLASLRTGKLAINLHNKGNAAIYTSCGDIPAGGKTSGYSY